MILAHLRKFDFRFSKIQTELRKVHERLSAIELTLVDLRRKVVSIEEAIVHTNVHVESVLDRIERRQPEIIRIRQCRPISPARHSWDSFFDNIVATDDFMPDHDQPTAQRRRSL